MSNRPLCPACSSPGCLGDIKCFKCGYYLPWASRTDGYSYLPKLHETIQDNINFKDLNFSPKGFHHEALEWLYDHYVFEQHIKKYNLAYYAQEHKVFIPCINHETGQITGYALRKIDKNQYGPKYRHYGSHEPEFMYNGPQDTIVLTEDRLSAIRVNEEFNVLCLFGTALSNIYLDLLIAQFKKIVFWLDPDKPGQDATKKLIDRALKKIQEKEVRLLFISKHTTYPCKVTAVSCTKYLKDPKDYPRYIIQQAVNEVLNA